MKRNRGYIVAVLAAMSIVALPSCSLLEKLQGEKAVKKEAVLPRDREQIQLQATHKTFNPAELAKGVITGDWAIETVNGKPAVGETSPYLKFVPSEKRVYGNNGCNTINAQYKFNPQDSTVKFDKVLSTLMMCGKQGITDVEINTALGLAEHYTWRLDDDCYYLTFFDKNNVELMTLMHQNFQFLNGTWQVVSIDDEPIEEPDMKLVIDVDEGKLHGNTGCNIINGSLETDMDTPNAISFQEIIQTRMACPEPNYETRLLVALEDAMYAKPISAGKVLLLNDQNQVVLTLVRTTDK